MSPARPRAAPPPVTPAWLEEAALAHLARYATSGQRLARLLETKARRNARFRPEEPAPDPALVAGWIAALIERLKTRRLLDDAAYAEARARRLHRQGQPLAAIRRALCAEGLSREQAAAATASFAAEDGGADPVAADLAAALAYLRRRRLGPFRPAAERAAARDKDLALLGRRGFSRFIAEAALDAPDDV